VYDFTVIGGGIAGCASASFLKKAGFKVLLLEKDTVCSGGSFGAGAFLSPKISKPSLYKDYINSSLRFSLDFYQENFPDIFKKVSLHKYPKDKADWQRIQSYEEFIDFDYEREEGFYRLHLAGIVEPKELCLRLLEGIDYKENCQVDSLEELDTKNIIIAVPNQKFLDMPYLKTKDIGGYRYDVIFDEYEKKDFISYKDLSVSCCFRDKIAIGATYIRGDANLKQCAEDDSEGLLERAKEFYGMKNLKVLRYYTGYRNMSYDFFPIVGAVIDAAKTLRKYPYIKKGAKVPSSKYIFYDNIYIHTALASRGFVFAPYNAKLLVDLIVNNKAVDERLSPVRLFKKYARKK